MFDSKSGARANRKWTARYGGKGWPGWLRISAVLRELLERQALRRIDGGSLTEGEVERLGETFLRLAEEIEKLKTYFGFTDDDLNLNLGPLGRLR